METSEIKRILDLDLRPKYEKSRDSIIEIALNKLSIVNEFYILKQKLLEKYGTDLNGRLIVEYSNSKKYNEELIPLIKEYLGESTKKGKIGGKVNDLEGEFYTIIMDKKFNKDEIIQYYTNKYEKNLNELEDSIVARIENQKPTSLRMKDSEYDFNFVINEEKSFTINTIIAGGEIQCLHYRTLAKLHNKVK